MKFLQDSILLVALLASSSAEAETVETEIPGVGAEVVELRVFGGVTRLAVGYRNTGASPAETKHFELGKLALIDVKSKKKYFAIKDANGQFIGGPMNDEIGGGRIYVKLQPGMTGLLWAYFEALPAGTVVSIELPQMFPFEDVVVGEGEGSLLATRSARSTPYGALATLASAKRADQALKVRLRLSAEPGVKVALRSPYFEYKNVYLFDTAGKRRYPLLKDSENVYQAAPMGQAMGGGSFLPKWDSTTLMSLTFQAPPDEVEHVDLILPDFLPMQNVAIEGFGGAQTGGVAASGKVLGLEGALKELAAIVTPEEIVVDLSADVLFDFDKAEIRPAAETALGNLLTVVNSRPKAKVSIVGHTDVRGEAAYNQALSLRRAESVRAWLAARGVDSGRILATGAGESQPLKTGNSEADHEANRRVRIRIRGPKS